jgi:hypothetical protein
MTVISVIVGSTREGRFSEKPAKWILQQLKMRDGVDARLLDLRDFPMPFFDQPLTPAMPGRPAFKNDVVQRWTSAIAQSDGAAYSAGPASAIPCRADDRRRDCRSGRHWRLKQKYNYGPSAELKNVIDWVYPEWHRRPVCFVSWGNAGGARGPAAPGKCDRASARPDSLIGPYPCVHPDGPLPGRRCRCQAGRAGCARRQADDRRSAVVDRNLEDGTRQCILTSHCDSWHDAKLA